jgi:hypothetical protein
MLLLSRHFRLQITHAVSLQADAEEWQFDRPHLSRDARNCYLPDAILAAGPWASMQGSSDRGLPATAIPPSIVQIAGFGSGTPNADCHVTNDLSLQSPIPESAMRSRVSYLFTRAVAACLGRRIPYGTGPHHLAAISRRHLRYEV